MTDEELQAIRERAEAATPGPWAEDGQDVVAGRYSDSIVDYVYNIGDVAFIAHARTDIPALLEHIAALEAEVDDLKEVIAVQDNDIAALKAANARMRAVVETVAERANTDAHGVTGLVRCYECGTIGHTPLEHKPGCLAEQARAILASASANEPPA